MQASLRGILLTFIPITIKKYIIRKIQILPAFQNNYQDILLSAKEERKMLLADFPLIRILSRRRGVTAASACFGWLPGLPPFHH